MDTTVERLKVGTQVIIGSYGVNNDEPHPVVWLKGSPNCDFITECAVDYLCFDAPERTGDGRRNLGNPDYRLSNIHTYLNSDRDDWFRKTHEADAPPNNVFSNRAQSYRNHYGFLYFLKLKLFSKKGIRPKATEDCANKKGRFGNFSWESYMNFWLAGKQDGFRDYALALSRSGYCERKYPRDCAGLRPMCRLKPETVVEVDENGVAHIKPYALKNETCTDAELFELLGVAQP